MKKHWKTLLLYVVLIAVLIGTVSFIFQSTKEEKILLGNVVDYFKADRVESFFIDENFYITMKVINVNAEGALVTKADGTFETTEVSYQLRSLDLFNEYCGEYVRENKNLIEYDIERQTTYPWWVSLVPYALIIVVLVVLWMFMMRSAGGPGSKRKRPKGPHYL